MCFDNFLGSILQNTVQNLQNRRKILKAIG